EAQPARVGAVGELRPQPVAAEVSGEDLLKAAERPGGRAAVEAEPGPGLRLALDDERARPWLVLVGVGPDPAGLRRLEEEVKRVEQLAGAEPDVLVPPLGDRAAELGMARPELAVHPVRGHHQVGRGQLRLVADVVLVADVHPELPGPGRDDVHEALAAHPAGVAVLLAGRAVAAEADHLVVPADRAPLDLFGRLSV